MATRQHTPWLYCVQYKDGHIRVGRVRRKSAGNPADTVRVEIHQPHVVTTLWLRDDEARAIADGIEATQHRRRQ